MVVRAGGDGIEIEREVGGRTLPFVLPVEEGYPVVHDAHSHQWLSGVPRAFSEGTVKKMEKSERE